MAGNPLVMVPSYQAVPPTLPSSNKNCILIVRVEDGLLGEIQSYFADFFAEFFKPNGGLPTGRVVLVGSLPRLVTREISSHMENLVRCIIFILARVGKGTVVITFIPVPLGGGGAGGPRRVRDLYDLDSWINGSDLGPGVLLRASKLVPWRLFAGDG
jgi:hypothetical protein